MFKVFGQFFKVLFKYVCGKFCNLVWKCFYAIGQVNIVTNGQIVKNNLAIWSHWHAPKSLLHSIRQFHRFIPYPPCPKLSQTQLLSHSSPIPFHSPSLSLSLSLSHTHTSSHLHPLSFDIGNSLKIELNTNTMKRIWAKFNKTVKLQTQRNDWNQCGALDWKDWK